MKTKKAPLPFPAAIPVKIQLPQSLHETMKEIREAQAYAQGSDVNLCRIYSEALEQFLNANEQQRPSIRPMAALPYLGAIIKVKIQILPSLHEKMKEVRQARYELEASDVKLARIYREAVELYINAKPQQKLLKEFRQWKFNDKKGQKLG